MIPTTTNDCVESQTVPNTGTRLEYRPLPRMEDFHRAVFEKEHLKPGLPVVVPGAAASWPAVQKWSEKYIADNCGQMNITASVDLPDTGVPYSFKDVDHRRLMTVNDFVDRMDSGDRCYIDQQHIDQFEGLSADYDFSIFEPPPEHFVALWMGSRTRSGFHYDFVDNFFVQVHGHKKAILAAPEDGRYLYPFADNHTKSQVDAESPDLDRHPLVAKVVLWEATLQPGDMMFIPKGWWHYLASSESSISLTCWYGQPLSPIGTMLSNGPRAWARLVAEFVWFGCLRRPHKKRLYSPPPTGKMVYDFCVSMLPWKRNPGPPE